MPLLSMVQIVWYEYTVTSSEEDPFTLHISTTAHNDVLLW